MSIAQGTPIRYTVDASSILILQRNNSRGGLYIEADPANSGNIFISFDDPAVAASGDKAGKRMTAGQAVTEEEPNVNVGQLWAIGSAASQVLIVREDFKLG